MIESCTRSFDSSCCTEDAFLHEIRCADKDLRMAEFAAVPEDFEICEERYEEDAKYRSAVCYLEKASPDGHLSQGIFITDAAYRAAIQVLLSPFTGSKKELNDKLSEMMSSMNSIVRLDRLDRGEKISSSSEKSVLSRSSPDLVAKMNHSSIPAESLLAKMAKMNHSSIPAESLLAKMAKMNHSSIPAERGGMNHSSMPSGRRAETRLKMRSKKIRGAKKSEEEQRGAEKQQSPTSPRTFVLSSAASLALAKSYERAITRACTKKLRSPEGLARRKQFASSKKLRPVLV